MLPWSVLRRPAQRPNMDGHPDAEVPEGHYTVPLEQARYRPEGNACTVIAWGTMVHVCEQAIKIQESIVNLLTYKRLSLGTEIPWSIQSRKQGDVSSSMKLPKTSGFGAEMSASIQERCFYHLEAPIQRVTGWDTPFPHTTEWDYLPSPQRIADAIKKTQEE